jgi:1-acyl-sn-glycerol-3-phosphate acyltransferase
MVYALTRLVCLVLFRVVWRPVVVGREHIPDTGPVILASNHLSFIDSIVIPLAVPRRVVFLAKAEYWEGRSLASLPRRLFFRTFGAVPVQRDQQSDAQASLDLARQVLARGDAFGIYPEGTRSRDGRLYRGRTGVGWLALAAGAPVVPVGLVGTDRVQPVGATMPRVHRVRVAFGEPVRPEAYAGLPPGRARREITDAVMDSVAALTGQDRAPGYNDRVPTATGD